MNQSSELSPLQMRWKAIALKIMRETIAVRDTREAGKASSKNHLNSTLLL
jgi:hypothetical protein